MKKITLALCVDEKGGVLLFGKRQSRDRVLIADFLADAGDKSVLISSFSEILFQNVQNVKICDDPVSSACDGDFVFIENIALSSVIDSVTELIIYNWNRHYPSDVKIDADPIACGFALAKTYDFQGSSHERITKEIYRRVKE